MPVLAACSPGEVRVAAVGDDGKLLDYAVWRPSSPDGVGDVQRGRISAVMQGLAGAFVALEGADGFLPDSAGAAGRGVGDAVLVRVVRAAQGGKGPRLTALSGDPGSGPPALLRRGSNPVERLAALHPGPVAVDDPAVALLLQPDLGDRIVIRPVLTGGLEDQIEQLGQPSVTLPGGMRATIVPTPALVAIDVDMAGATDSRTPKQAAQEAMNRAMLPALARQIRLRNLSGAILVDLAGLSVRRRAALAGAVQAALAPDPEAARLLGFTQLGLAEITRRRVHPPLHEVLAGPHAAGLAALRRAVEESAPRRPIVLRASPAVIAALEGDPAALRAYVQRTGCALAMRSDPRLLGCAWVLEHAERE